MKRTLLLAIAGLAQLSTIAQNTGIGTVSPTDQLHTTGSVRFQNYSGVGTRLLYLDSAGRITIPPAGTLFANSTRYSIPDNGCASNSGASSPIAVSGLAASVPTSKISVRLNITHTFDGDLSVFLFSPAGNVLPLSLNNGSAGDHYTGTIFTDDAPDFITAGAAPFPGRYRPFGTLTATCAITPTVANFTAMGSGGNINPNGTWTLKVFDNAASDTGSIQSWQITFDGQNGFGTTGATGPVPYFSNGSLALSSITNSPAGNVGIGTASPQAKLDVAGTVRIADGTQGAGKVLTSNAAGVASWQPDAPLNSSYTAGLNSSTTLSGSGFNPTLIPYSTAATNLSCYDDAGAFSNSTSTFTAPAAGVYHFDVSLNTGLTTATASTNLTLVSVINGVTGPQYQTYTATGNYLPPTVAYSFNCKLAAGATVKMGMVLIGIASISVTNSKDVYFSGYRIY